MPLRLLVLVPLAVAINLAMGQIVHALALPVFLDAVGTILVAALAGPGAGIAAGTTSQVLNTMLSGNYTWLAFTPVQVVIALYAAGAGWLGAFRRPVTALAAGMGQGIVAAACSVPISYFAFGGVTAGGVTLVTTLLRASGLPLWVAVATASTATDVLDKSIAYLLVFAVLRGLPTRVAARYPLAARALGRDAA